MSIYSIYKVTNKITGKVYIGFDSNWPARQAVHKSLSKKPKQKLHKSIRKHGWNNFHWEIIYQSLDGEHCLNIMENYFINEYDSFNNGYNMTLGGEGTLGKKTWLGKKHKKETKQKISNAIKGRKKSEEHSKNISKALKNKPGRKWSLEQRQLFSKKKKGIKPYEMTEEIKRKISFSNSGGKHYSAIPVVINNIHYSCKKEACKKLQINKYQLEKILSSNL